MGDKFSVRPEVQRYMDENPVHRLCKGSQSIVYGADGVVVKKFREASALEASAEMSGIPSAYNTYKFGKDRLGGLVVPFEIAEGIRVRVVGASTEEETFDRAAVQERSDPLGFLGAQLTKACNERDIGRVEELLNLLIDFRIKLLQRGVFFNDSHPDNIVVSPDSGLLLTDIGAVKFLTREQAIGIVSGLFYKFSPWFALLQYRFVVSGDVKGQLGERWIRFKDEFRKFYDPEVLGRMYPRREAVRAMSFTGGKHKKSGEFGGLRVPDVRLPRKLVDL